MSHAVHFSTPGTLGVVRRGFVTVLGIVLCFSASGCEGRTLAVLTPGLSPGNPSWVPKGKAGCVPNCRSKGCGPDGCGGQCGKCVPGKLCLADRCVKNRTLELCHLVTGRWSGVMQTRPLHYLEGRIYLKGKACQATLKVSYNLGRRGRAWVVQELVITFNGTHMLMRGVRLTQTSSNSQYNLDRFAGRLDKKLKRFSGLNRDVRGSSSPFYLNKK